MKPVMKVVLDDKPAEATVNLLFEDIYNRLGKVDLAMKGVPTLKRPHINKAQGGVELPFASITVACDPVEDAVLYVWAYRTAGTTSWISVISADYETTIRGLLFDRDYEIRVMALGTYLVFSDWSVVVPVKTPVAPTPSTVTGVSVTNQGTFVDPTTGVTLARVKVEWNNNTASEMVDVYEVMWSE